MKYIGQFRSIDNELYTVNIITGGSEVITQNITLTDNPFTTEMDTTDENIYKPVKYQGATIGVLTQNESDYMFNVYSGSANGTMIKLLNGENNVVWAGFATPVLYDNGYTSVREKLEIEAIDGLSILQYYKYSAAQKTIKSFIDILQDILQKCEVYDELFISSAIKLSGTSNTSILNELYISEQNFFDKKEDNETDDDVAWTCKDVLEEICKYLGVICVAYGSKVYMLDYDAIKHNVNTYWKYSLDGSTTPTSVELSNTVAVTGDLYRGATSSISLDNVYNKVTVKDDFYTFEDLIPDIYDTAQNITASSDEDIASSTNINNGSYGEVVQGKQGNSPNDTNNNMIALLDRVYDPEDEIYTYKNAIFVKYFKHPQYTFYSYNGSSNTTMNYTDTKNYYGAIIAKFDVKKLNKKDWFWQIIIQDIAQRNLTIDDFLARENISSISFNNYILMLNPTGNNHIPNTNMTSYPYFESNGDDLNCLFGGDNTYIIISGSYYFHYMSEDPYPIPEDEIDIAEGRYAMDAGETFLLAKLQWGNQYWNGSEWVNLSTTFKIPYLKDTTSDEERRADATMYKNIDFVNTVTWRIGTTEKGYIIPMPTGKVLSGTPKITIYKPYDPNYHSSKSGDNKGQWYKHSVVLLKDFKMKAVIGDPTYSDVNNTDTKYTNIINEHHVQSLSDINFKICTNDGKNPNYSSVGYISSGDYQFLNKIYNSALTSNNVIDYNGDTSNGLLRPEEWLIYRLTNQYSSPRIRLQLELNTRYMPYTTMTDHWLSGKTFVIDSQSTNFYTGQTTVTLVEKG